MQQHNTKPVPNICPICSFTTKVPTTVRIVVPQEWTDTRSNSALICSNCEACILTDITVVRGQQQQNVPILRKEFLSHCACVERGGLVKMNVVLQRYRENPHCGLLLQKCSQCGFQRSIDVRYEKTGHGKIKLIIIL